MAKYRYTALDANNVKVHDIVEAKDESEFRRIMRNRNLFPVKFKALDEKRYSYRFRSNEISEFCRELAGMLASGITMVRSIEIIKERDLKPKIKAIYEKMHKDIQQGVSLSEAMEKHGDTFPLLLINMIASGESSGKLENVMARMALHYEKQHILDGKITRAMRYPKILAVATIGVVLIIFTLVLPGFFDMLEEFELPIITRIVIAISEFLISYWYLLVIVVLTTVIFVRYMLTIYKVRLAFDKAKLKMPLVGKLLKTIYTARFSRTLSSLYSSGVSMIHSLEITGTIIMNTYIASQFPALVKDVRNGESLSESIRKIDGFDTKLPNTVLVGEEAGKLDTMLVSISDSFEYEAEEATEALVAYSEPVMIVVMGLVIMVVLLSVMLPMAAIYEGFGV
ncbi:MAG: type II secretion system F family protein [Defluviitaleaceae bacterium]|nr:type II secretion system F family protein [Defluviitaleaceae bacterium]